ncbi:MAG: hypothetical protein EBU46_20080 [Nitrosomonadaceae bacterium]|nr:hypothetical protein [Nitrosomonadaceae bacterium]
MIKASWIDRCTATLTTNAFTNVTAAANVPLNDDQVLKTTSSKTARHVQPVNFNNDDSIQ